MEALDYDALSAASKWRHLEENSQNSLFRYLAIPIFHFSTIQNPTSYQIDPWNLEASARCAHESSGRLHRISDFNSSTRDDPKEFETNMATNSSSAFGLTRTAAKY